MLFGGFLKQMNDTIRYNLDLREKLRRKPSKKFRQIKKQSLNESRVLSQAEREQLVLALKAEQEKEKKKKRIALLISILLTLILFSLTWWILAS